MSPNHSGELARYYSFRLDRTSNIRIDMGSSTIDSWLTLRRGAIFVARSWLSTMTEAASGSMRVSIEAWRPVSTIEATSLRAGETGSFSLVDRCAHGPTTVRAWPNESNHA